MKVTDFEKAIQLTWQLEFDEVVLDDECFIIFMDDDNGTFCAEFRDKWLLTYDGDVVCSFNKEFSKKLDEYLEEKRIEKFEEDMPGFDWEDELADLSYQKFREDN